MPDIAKEKIVAAAESAKDAKVVSDLLTDVEKNPEKVKREVGVAGIAVALAFAGIRFFDSHGKSKHKDYQHDALLAYEKGLIMSTEVKKSSAPLFVAYGSSPDYHEPNSLVMNKNEMLEYAAYENKYAAGDFSHGDILCELVPLGFFYKDENGEVVQGDVSTSALIAMLKLQSDISEGIAEHVDRF